MLLRTTGSNLLGTLSFISKFPLLQLFIGINESLCCRISFAKFVGLRLFAFMMELLRDDTYCDYAKLTFIESSFRGLTFRLILGRAIGLGVLD